MGGLFRLEGDALVPAPFEEAATTYHLSADDGQLWSIGHKDIFAHDGTVWQRIE
jgi:hypothetical protein